MSAFSFSHSSTFTITHAKYLASKIAADLNVCSRLHGRPTVSQVESYNEELIELLRHGYLSRYVSVHGPVKNYWSSGLRVLIGFVRSLSGLSGL